MKQKKIESRGLQTNSNRCNKAHGQLWRFGLPCRFFSFIQHSNKGTRRKDTPEDDISLAREREGNLILEKTLVLIDILKEHHSHWTLENPKSSYVGCMPGMKKKLEDSGVYELTFDQCSYGLRLTGEQGFVDPCKSYTHCG